MENEEVKIISLKEILNTFKITKQSFFKTFIYNKSKSRRSIFKKVAHGKYKVDAETFYMLETFYEYKRQLSE